MKHGRSANCLFCDDIRHEVGNKFSLIGIYAGDMLVFATRFPVTLPRLAIHIWATTPARKPFQAISCTIVGTAGEHLAKVDARNFPDASAPPGGAKGASKLVVGMMAMVSPVQISKEGEIEVWAELDGEREKAGRISVKLHGPPPTGVGVVASPLRPEPPSTAA